MTKGWEFRKTTDVPWLPVTDVEATQLMTYPDRDNGDISRVKKDLLLGGKLMVRGGMIQWSKR